MKTMFEDVLAAIEEIEKFPPLPVRIEMAEDVWRAFIASMPRNCIELTTTFVATFRGLPIVVPGMQRPGEWATVYKSRG